MRFLKSDSWQPLKASGCELTTIPSPKEAELALLAGDATIYISHPSEAEYIEKESWDGQHDKNEKKLQYNNIQ
ncbi:MAG: hypothetical protein FWC97_12565 [Treponema sp.]|nr:hypothetical protein [Treponema sp.]